MSKIPNNEEEYLEMVGALGEETDVHLDDTNIMNWQSKLSLYEVKNGYMATDYIRVLVIARDEESAKDQAKPVFKEKGEGRNQDSDYWEDLKAKIIFDNLLEEQASEIRV